MKKEYSIVIGVTNSPIISPQEYFVYNTDMKDYTYALRSDGTIHDGKNGWTRLSNNGEKERYRQNDKVSMILNSKTSTLSFIINDTKEINACENINQTNNEFKMFVTMYNTNDRVKLLHFSEQ